MPSIFFDVNHIDDSREMFANRSIKLSDVHVQVRCFKVIMIDEKWCLEVAQYLARKGLGIS